MISAEGSEIRDIYNKAQSVTKGTVMSANRIILILSTTLLLFNIIKTQETGTVTDIDGNVYQTVKIGEQWWTAENLRTTKYRNGDAIPTNLDNTQWENTTSGAYAIYPHTEVDGISSDEEMIDAYGKLYNWYAVIDSRGLCPEGWIVPDDDEWNRLGIYLGLSLEEAEKFGWRGNDEGGKMKSTRVEADPHPRWNSPNTGATNESGFKGLPGGRRAATGSFSLLEDFGEWWSTTEYDERYSWYHLLTNDRSSAGRGIALKPIGFSVRCISKNATSSHRTINDVPVEFVLKQNYPNPFNSSTIIKYGLPEKSYIQLEVYDRLGRLVIRLANEYKEAGYHEVTFDASHLPSGVYIYRLQTGEYVESRKMLYLK